MKEALILILEKGYLLEIMRDILCIDLSLIINFNDEQEVKHN